MTHHNIRRSHMPVTAVAHDLEMGMIEGATLAINQIDEVVVTE
jgi:hypothetical protein